MIKKSAISASALRAVWLVGQCLALALGGCVRDDEAGIDGPSGALAVGAFHSLRFGDACAGGGKVHLCSAEKVKSATTPEVDNAAIAEVVPAAQHPMSAGAGAIHYIVGKSPGTTRISMSGMFSDGSQRSAERKVEVRSIDRVSIDVSCPGSPPSNNFVVPVGGTGEGSVQLWGKDQQLAGWIPDAVQADGLSLRFVDSNDVDFTWQAPSVPTKVAVLSRLVPGLTIGTLQAFGPADVTSIRIKKNYPHYAALTKPTDFDLDTHVIVGELEPCLSLPVMLHSLTPTICIGPDARTVWKGTRDTGGSIRGLREGVCRVGASMDGEKVLGTTEFSVFFVQAPAFRDRPGFGNPCSVEGATTCAEQTVGICREKRWSTHVQCAADQVCDLVPPQTRGCTAGGPCAACRGLRQ